MLKLSLHIKFGINTLSIRPFEGTLLKWSRDISMINPISLRVCTRWRSRNSFTLSSIEHNAKHISASAGEQHEVDIIEVLRYFQPHFPIYILYEADDLNCRAIYETVNLGSWEKSFSLWKMILARLIGLCQKVEDWPQWIWKLQYCGGSQGYSPETWPFLFNKRCCIFWKQSTWKVF